MSLPRERLTAILADSALTSVELVIAPPGFGKTTLLREHAAADSSAVFISLPEPTDLEAFVRAVIAGTAPSAMRSIGTLFEGAESTLEQRVGDWIVSRLRDFDGTLIVDDLHRASADERVARVLAAVISATHGRMRWIVASRESPAFPMGSWIARGWMGLPITGDDLSFTADEAAALASSLNIAISDGDIASIVDETLGWPIGVRLALTLVVRKRGIGQTRVQTRDALFALLDDEVWAPLRAEARELIGAAALMPAPSISTLQAAGFSEAPARMLDVFARVPFIAPIDDDAFAIHDLFREFVATKTQHAAKTAGDVATRMGSALVAGGNPADGLRLLIDANDEAGVAEALTHHAFDLLETGQRSAVNVAVAYLEERGQSDTGLVLAVRGALSYADGSASNSANLFTRALERNAPSLIRGEISRRLALNFLNRGMIGEAHDTLLPLESDTTLSFEDRLEVRATSAQITAIGGLRGKAEIEKTIHAIERDVPGVRPAMQARTLVRLGNAALYNGNMETAEHLARDGAHLAAELGMDTIAAMAYATLYSAASFSDLDDTRALSFARSLAAAAERAANPSLLVFALRAQYLIAAMHVDIEETRKLDADLTSLVDTRTYLDPFFYRSARALQYAASADPAKAEATLRGMPLRSLTAPQRARIESFVILMQLLRGKRTAAASALERMLLGEAPADPVARVDMAHAYAYRGLAYWALDRPALARRSFEFNSAELPPREHVIIEALRLVSEMPHPLSSGSAIDAIASTLVASGYRAYAELLRHLVNLDANDVELSSAELETLREFDRVGGRAADVAMSLGKSRYTVQNQIQSAIKKLGCSGRAEALAYARQRGWLDRTSS